MELHRQDVLVALKLSCSEFDSFAGLGSQLGLSASQTHGAMKRAGEAGLVDFRRRIPYGRNLLEFLIHGLKYVFPVKRGPVTRGMATAHSAPPLRELIVDNGSALVWPDPEGDIRGESIEPLYKTSPAAAKNDSDLYARLALIDALRIGRARERKLAEEKLGELITQ